ncbi:unnamed protein product [marine sediment metagenome]|uniref:Uncharacterized protein n=1 Tax=marine sediment metagenome TaxID=412755 RepID=X1GPQ0_9ZZZZ
MRKEYAKLKQLLNHTEYKDERARILDTMISLGTYRQLKNLYDDIDDPDERYKVFRFMLVIGNYNQLHKLLDENEYEEKRAEILMLCSPSVHIANWETCVMKSMMRKRSERYVAQCCPFK